MSRRYLNTARLPHVRYHLWVESRGQAVAVQRWQDPCLCATVLTDPPPVLPTSMSDQHLVFATYDTPHGDALVDAAVHAWNIDPGSVCRIRVGAWTRDAVVDALQAQREMSYVSCARVYPLPDDCVVDPRPAPDPVVHAFLGSLFVPFVLTTTQPLLAQTVWTVTDIVPHHAAPIRTWRQLVQYMAEHWTEWNVAQLARVACQLFDQGILSPYPLQDPDQPLRLLEPLPPWPLTQRQHQLVQLLRKQPTDETTTTHVRVLVHSDACGDMESLPLLARSAMVQSMRTARQWNQSLQVHYCTQTYTTCDTLICTEADVLQRMPWDPDTSVRLLQQQYDAGRWTRTLSTWTQWSATDQRVLSTCSQWMVIRPAGRADTPSLACSATTADAAM